jgi:Rrf2 family protein
MLSKKTKYAFKALIYLAKQAPKSITPTQTIAKEANIPRKFLELILIDLKRANLVSSKQGSQGGYYLLKSADTINLADIYRLFDGAVALLPCASEKFYEPCEDCVNEAECRLRWSLQEVREQTLIAMEKISIQDLTN